MADRYPPRRNGCGRTRRQSTAATCGDRVDRQTAEFSKTTRVSGATPKP